MRREAVALNQFGESRQLGPRCRSRLAVIRWHGVPGARSGPAPGPKWAIAIAAAGTTSAHHRPSAASPPQTLHPMVCREVSPSVPSGRRGVYAGAFPRRVMNQPAATSRLISRSRPIPTSPGSFGRSTFGVWRQIRRCREGETCSTSWPDGAGRLTQSIPVRILGIRASPSLSAW
jgi:hypothetical protein